ncbi:MAG: hypothetical protein JXR75_09565 [Rhodobacteraceae bacterium]|nr:hypothetical protein [Paracoccaceae bacterium]
MRQPCIAIAAALMLTAGAAGAEGRASLLTPDVQMAVGQGIAACHAALTGGPPVARALERQGFAPWRRGHRMKIDNPLIFAGDSSVSVEVDRRGTCRVRAVPMRLSDLPVLQAVTARSLGGSASGLNLRFVGVRDGFEVAMD